MGNASLDPEHQKALERLETELELEDEIVKASEQLEMQDLIQKAY